MARKILVVDNEPDVASFLEGVLAAWGYETRSAEPFSAMAALRTQSPHAVLLDLDRSGRAGLELMLDAQSARPGLPVLVLTSGSDMQMVRRAMDLGAADYIVKPIDFPHLRNCLRSAFSAART